LQGFNRARADSQSSYLGTCLLFEGVGPEDQKLSKSLQLLFAGRICRKKEVSASN